MLKLLLGSAGIAFVVGFGSGWMVNHDHQVVKQMQLQIVVLKANAAAQAGELKQRAEDVDTLEQYRQKYEDLRAQLSHPDGVCFDADDTKRLQQLWD